MSNILTTTTAAKDVATILAALGYGTIGTDLFVHEEPDGDQVQDNIVSVRGTTNWRPAELTYSWESPSVQVLVRRKAANREVAEAYVLTLMNALQGYTGTVGSVKYHLIKVVNGPMALLSDARGRFRFTFNCDIQRSG